MYKKSKKIGVFQLVLISISAIVSLKSLPLFAEMGFSIVFFLGIATMFFFIPITMVVSELSSTWPISGGCYVWIKKAYGKQVALFCMWAYWMESIIWFPTMLIFVVAMLAHTLSPIYPGLENNSLFLIFGIIVVFWLLTVLNFYGIKFSAIFSAAGVLIGTILPMFLIITIGCYWLINGNQLNISFNTESLFPKFNFNNLVFFSGILLGISGIELIAFYINDIENPQKNIVRSIFFSSFLILFIYIAGSLSVAIVVPRSEICLASGIIQALKIFFTKINMTFIVPLLAFLLLLGSLSGMNTWIMGPSKGIFVAASDGFLPSFFTKTNSKNVPVNLLIIQAVIGSSLSAIFFVFINSINGLVWIFVCLSFQFASFLYIMIFLSVIKLRKMYPNLNRPYKVPYVKFISCLGILMCSFTFFVSYAQPMDIASSDKQFYSILLLLSFVILMIPPLIFILLKKNRK